MKSNKCCCCGYEIDMSYGYYEYKNNKYCFDCKCFLMKELIKDSLFKDNNGRIESTFCDFSILRGDVDWIGHCFDRAIENGKIKIIGIAGDLFQ